MINLDKIQSMWQEDCKIDIDNMHEESIKVPQLHSKYHEILNNLILLRTKAQKIQKSVRHERYFEFSDATLQILNSNYKPSVLINFQDAFPVSLSTLEFDVTTRDYAYFTAEVTFKYTIYNITDPNGNRICLLYTSPSPRDS